MPEDPVSLLHPRIKELLTHRGIASLYPPQKEAILLGVTGSNLIISIPTASGKTLIAELLALHKIFSFSPSSSDSGGFPQKILYLTPLKALAAEKYAEFHDIWANFGLRVGISTSDVDQIDTHVFQNHLILLTNEKADAILRMHPTFIRDIAMIIADEIHLINDENRGVTLEFLLNRIRILNPTVQIIGLSATIQNAGELASWLNAKLITSTWRPIPLKEGFFLNNEIVFADGITRKVRDIPDLSDVAKLTIDMLKEGGQVLIFTNSRKNAEQIAESLSTPLEIIASKGDRALFQSVITEFETGVMDSTELSVKLIQTLRGGVAFHHAGLGSDQLTFIVDNYSRRRIHVIACTPTLAAGVNTPARRVIIKSLYRYSGDKGTSLIPIMEYKQMAGRAGRPRYDSYGEVVILGSDPTRLTREAIAYIDGTPEAITSKLADVSKLYSHLLSLIVGKHAQSEVELLIFLQGTFYAYQLSHLDSALYAIPTEKLSQSTKKMPIHRPKSRTKGGRGVNPLGTEWDDESMFSTASDLYTKQQITSVDKTTMQPLSHLDGTYEQDITPQLTEQIHKITSYLTDHRLIAPIGPDLPGFHATPFGDLAVKAYLLPQDAVHLRENMEYARRLLINHELILHPVSWLHLMCSLQDFPKLFLRGSDYPPILNFLEQHGDNLIISEVWEPEDDEFPAFAAEIKTTMVLFEWIEEIPDSEIATHFNIGTGDLHRLTDTILWLCRGAIQIAYLDHYNDFHSSLSLLYMRLAYGVRESLVPFVQLTGIGRIRARKLYQAGYKSLTELESATVEQLSQIPLIGLTLAQNLWQQIHNPDKKSKKKRRQLPINISLPKEELSPSKKGPSKSRNLDQFVQKETHQPKHD